MPYNHLNLCRPLLLPPSIFPSIRVFSNDSVLPTRWPKYWSFSFNISPPSEYSGLISFRMDWLDLLVVQGTLKSLLQHHSSKSSILQCSAFFIAQLLHPYMTTGKTTALTRWTFAGKVMSLLFNMLSRLGFPDISVGKESACNAEDPGSIPGSRRSPGEGTGYPLQYSWAYLVAQLEKNLPEIQEIWVQSLGWEDPLKKGKATHSNGLENSMDWSMGSQRVGHD